MTEIYFIRHGQASFGSENYDRLSPLGIRQAELLGDYLAHLGLTFQAVYSGSLVRQVDTARTFIRQMPSGSTAPLCITDKFDEFDAEAIITDQIDDLVREDPALAEAAARVGSDFDAFKLIFDRAIQRIVTTPGSTNSLAVFVHDVRQGIERVTVENGTRQRIAVFTSGGTISVVMQLALNLATAETLHLGWEIFNTSVSVLRARKSRLHLKTFNSIAHLEQHRDPDLITYL